MPKFKHTLRERKLDRVRVKRYHDKLKKLGFPGGVTPKSYLSILETSKRWHKLHPERRRAAQNKYRAKIIAKMGTSSDHNYRLYAILYGRRANKERNCHS